MTVQIFALKITGRNACGPQDKICSMFVSQKIHLPFSSHFFLTRAMCQKNLKIASSLQIDVKIHMAKGLCVNPKQKTCSTPVSQIRPFSYCSHPCSVKLSVCAIMFDCMRIVYWPQKYVLKKESLPFFFFLMDFLERMSHDFSRLHPISTPWNFIFLWCLASQMSDKACLVARCSVFFKYLCYPPLIVLYVCWMVTYTMNVSH